MMTRTWKANLNNAALALRDETFDELIARLRTRYAEAARDETAESPHIVLSFAWLPREDGKGPGGASALRIMLKHDTPIVQEEHELWHDTFGYALTRTTMDRVLTPALYATLANKPRVYADPEAANAYWDTIDVDPTDEQSIRRALAGEL
jgi:hypothetical protein